MTRIFCLSILFFIIYGVILFAQTTGTVRGQIVEDTPAQNPIPSVKVVVIDSNGAQYETITDRNGQYEISLSPRAFLISCRKEGYVSAMSQVTVSSGDEHMINLKMRNLDTLKFLAQLIKALGDENEDVRRYAAWELRERGEAAQDAVPALLEALMSDESVGVRLLMLLCYP